jgi:hypothetical protein
MEILSFLLLVFIIGSLYFIGKDASETKHELKKLRKFISEHWQMKEEDADND